MNQTEYLLTEAELQELIRSINGHGEEHLTLADYTEVSGNTSDGYHTFNELYEHRNVLFCSFISHSEYDICNHAIECFWSRLHSDGTMFDNMIIVGMKTPIGYITYHMDQKFTANLPGDIEVERAPEWEGHTSFDVLDRLQEYFTP